MNASSFSGGALAHDSQALALWEKLRRLSFDSGSGPRTFAVRLASEQGWSAAFAARVIEEYRRFLLLFALSERRRRAAPTTIRLPAAVQIVPPDAVDKVWHLHLLYTRSYWDDLCDGILGFPLHHVPADGSDGEAASLDEVYRGVLEAYEQTFGQSAPTDIWPAAQSRRQATAPLANLSSSAKATPGSSPKSVLVKGMMAALAVLVIALLLMVKREVALGGVTLLALLFILAGTFCIGVTIAARNGGRRRTGLCSGGYIVGGASCGGWISSDGGHSSSHDGGGHSHSCGGHSCGGHGCGGSCGGGH